MSPPRNHPDDAEPPADLAREISELRAELARITERLDRAERAMSSPVSEPAAPSIEQRHEQPADSAPPLPPPTPDDSGLIDIPPLPPTPVPATPFPPAPPKSEVPPSARPIPGPSFPAEGTPAPPSVPTHAAPSTPPGSTPTATPPTSRPVAPRSGPRVAPRVAKKRARSNTPLEMLLGGKLTAWIGSLVVVAAIGLLAHLSITEGWWGGLPAWLRCMLIAGFGGLLIVAGEVALRRISRPASVGLFGAGLGVLYLDSFASFEIFNVVGREMAFVLMAFVAAVGFAITLRTRFRTIGVLSLIGGYVTPLLLAGGDYTLGVAAYLTALFAVGLGLSAARPVPFRALRYVALGGQLLIGFVWILTSGSAHWAMSLVFISIWWAMVTAEAILAALAGTSPRGNPVAVVISTAAYVTVGTWILFDWAPAGSEWVGAFTLAIAALCGAAALHFGPGLDGLRGQLTSAMDRLAITLWVQSGVLLIVAVAQQFDGFGETVSWLAIALASIEVGRRLPSRGLDVFGVVVGALALLGVVFLEPWFTPTMATLRFTVLDTPVTDWAILALIAAGFVHVAAHRFRAVPGSRWRFAPPTLASIGTLVVLIVASQQCDGLVMTGAWLAVAVGLIATRRFAVRERYLEIAMVVLLLTAARWLLFDTLVERLDANWNAMDRRPVLNPQMALAVAIAVTVAWATRCLRRREAAPATASGAPGPLGLAWTLGLAAACVIALIGVSFEVDRVVEALATRGVSWSIGHVRQVLLTLTWTIGAAGIGLLARLLRPETDAADTTGSWLARFAWVLLVGCTIKWIVIDTFYWTVMGDTNGAQALARIVNVQMITGITLAAALLLMWWGARPLSGLATVIGLDGRNAADYRALNDPDWPLVATCLIVLWGLSFEVDRFVAGIAPNSTIFDPSLIRILWWTGLWAVGGAAMNVWGTRRTSDALRGAGAVILGTSAVAWLTIGSLGWRITHGRTPAAVILNLQCATGVLIMVLLFVGVHLQRHRSPITGRPASHPFRMIGLALIALIGLWLGSLEIDRLPTADHMARLAGLSVYWALYGVFLVVIGFARAAAIARYAGLALLAITVLKVLLVDLSTVDRTWRVVSFLVSGLLLIGTSVLYWRLSPDGRDADAASPRADADGDGIEWDAREEGVGEDDEHSGV